MKKPYIYILFLFSLFFTIIACKKEKTSWNSDWNVPIIHGELSLGDLIPQENIENNSENFASLVYRDIVYSFTIDTLIKLPDTTITHEISTPLPSLNLSPGTEISDNNIDQLYDLGEIQLKRLIVDEGEATISIKSPWQGKTKTEFVFPKVKDANGNVFSKTYYLEAGSSANPVEMTDVISLKDYDFDLTGASGDLFNYITANFKVASNEETNSFTVTNTEIVEIKFSFNNLKPKYAKGYFGEYELADTSAVNIEPLKKIIDGNIDLDSIRLNLTLENSFKIIAQATFTQLKGINSNNNSYLHLVFLQLNQVMNINPASGGLWDYAPSQYQILINSVNSNVLDFLENLPDSIRVGYKIHINPFGNVHGGDDELFPTSKLNIYLDGEFPLHFGANQLTLCDTLKINFTNNGSLQAKKGSITLKYTNGFPLGADIKFELLNASGGIVQTILANSSIQSGIYSESSQSTNQVSGNIVFDIDENTVEQLKNTEKIALKLVFSTHENQKIKMNISDTFYYNLYSDLNINLSF